MAGGTVPRADKVLMREVNADELKTIVLYSDDAYMEDNFWRRVIANIYTDSARALSVELEESSYEELDCPMKTKRCYTYRARKLTSYNSALSFHGVLFYSSNRVERRIPKKMIKLGIESTDGSAETFTRLLYFIFQIFQRRVSEHKTEYMSYRHFYVLA